MTIRLCVVAMAAIAAWGLKHHYAVASADELRWILWPTAQLTGAVTGTTFVPSPGEGYLSHERLFLIEKSCAGVNFMIAAFGVLVGARLWRVDSGLSGIGLVAGSLLVSYPAAVLVNVVRITIAMWLSAHPVVWTGLDAGEVHRIEGVAVYFGGLLLLHAMAQRLRHGASVLGAGR
jgi:exosortase K